MRTPQQTPFGQIARALIRRVVDAAVHPPASTRPPVAPRAPGQPGSPADQDIILRIAALEVLRLLVLLLLFRQLLGALDYLGGEVLG